MAKHVILMAFLFLLQPLLHAQVVTFDFFVDGQSRTPATGKELLQHMHKKYKHSPCREYTFSQRNTHYRNDSVTGHSEWHEAISFPDKFRINFDGKTGGDFVIFRNDSSYRYREGKLARTKYDGNSLLLLLGGMYYRPYADVLKRLGDAHYNTELVSERSWNGMEVYVIGAAQNDSLSNQFWVDKKTLSVQRIIEKINDTDRMDMRFEAHQKLCGGYTETKVSFRRNGRLEQVEEYYDLKPVNALPDSVFDPK